MSSKLLTIAIPTFNRAHELDRQLEWVSRVIRGHEADCEVLVSDNCSTDDTQAIAQKWKDALPEIRFRIHKNSENIGLIPNIAQCLRLAETAYVWAIGDDDPIQDRALGFVLDRIHRYPDLSLVFLNFSGRNQLTGEPVSPPTIEGNRWLDADCDEGTTDGEAIFEYCLAKSIGSVQFLTATIYRTELVQKAMQIWPTSYSNWDALVYWAGYCAARGRVIVTKETFMECIVGVSYWQKDPQHAINMQLKDAPEIFRYLQQTGYSDCFYWRMMLQAFQDAKIRVFLGALRRWPLLTLKLSFPFIFEVGLSAIGLVVYRLKNLGQPQFQRVTWQ